MPSSQKTFRVFVSSTFSDILEERRQIRKIFPLALRNYAKVIMLSSIRWTSAGVWTRRLNLTSL